MLFNCWDAIFVLIDLFGLCLSLKPASHIKLEFSAAELWPRFFHHASDLRIQDAFLWLVKPINCKFLDALWLKKFCISRDGLPCRLLGCRRGLPFAAEDLEIESLCALSVQTYSGYVDHHIQTELISVLDKGLISWQWKPFMHLWGEPYKKRLFCLAPWTCTCCD